MNIDIILVSLQLVIMIAIGFVSNFLGRKRFANNYVLTGLIILALAITSIITFNESAKEKELQHTIDGLSNSNAEQLELLHDIAKREYPDLPSSEALEKLKLDISNIESRTTILEKETQKTIFIVGDESGKQLPDGTFETKFNLIPIGKKIIPLFKVGCQTRNNAKIIDIIIFRNNTPLTGMSSTSSSPDKTFSDVMILNSIEPGILNIFVLTDKKPEMFCDYMPKN